MKLFTYGDLTAAERTIAGQSSPSFDCDGGERFSLEPTYRMKLLTDCDASAPDVPELAHTPMLWCGEGHVEEPQRIPGMHVDGDRLVYLFNLSLVNYNDVYVADHEPYRRLREQYWAERGAGSKLTCDQVRAMQAARGRTLTPIDEYAGGFVAPIYLVARRLALAEAQAISGPWCYYSGSIRPHHRSHLPSVDELRAAAARS